MTAGTLFPRLLLIQNVPLLVIWLRKKNTAAAKGGKPAASPARASPTKSPKRGKRA